MFWNWRNIEYTDLINFVIAIHTIYIKQKKICFTLYPAFIREGRGDFVL